MAIRLEGRVAASLSGITVNAPTSPSIMCSAENFLYRLCSCRK